jgi:aryl-alcohol dehydrogenase-like predicted oxidoreductase
MLEHMPLGGAIDTARVYGRSEAVIDYHEGLGNRSQVFIATKTPMFGDFSIRRRCSTCRSRRSESRPST